MNKETVKKISFYFPENSLNSSFTNNKQITLIMNAKFIEKIEEKVAKTGDKGNKQKKSKISFFFIIF